MCTNELKNTKAITLIALVITITILLILSGATVQLLSSDSGVIKSTTKAKEETEYVIEKELVETATIAAKMEGEGNILLII